VRTIIKNDGIWTCRHSNYNLSSDIESFESAERWYLLHLLRPGPSIFMGRSDHSVFKFSEQAKSDFSPKLYFYNINYSAGWGDFKER
jgi:hypothetical protein